MEPPSRLPSPWANESTQSPLPSPCPPPSPVVWVQQDWTPVPRKDPTHTRSLPLIPSAADGHPHFRSNTTFSPLPSHPEFLRNLQSHPMIIQRGDEPLRTPSPASSIELVFHGKQQDEIPSGSVPFPMSSCFTSPALSSSPRPLPSVDGSQRSVHSLSSADSTPARTPDPIVAFPAVPPPPPLPLARNSVQVQKRNSSPQRTSFAAPRPRLPALRPSSGSAFLGGRPQSVDSKSSRHPLFYMQDSMIVLKVEGSLYKVHKYLLEHHSDFLREFLSDESDAMGRTDDRPIPLPENITQKAFDCLLSFLYSGIYDPATVSLQDWVTLLRVSTHLQFAKVRQYAVRELTARRASLAAVHAIVLAKELDITSWLEPAYAELVRRGAPLDDEEAEQLGARTAAQVARAREMLRAEEYALFQQRRYGTSYVRPERPDEQLVARAVSEVFRLAG